MRVSQKLILMLTFIGSLNLYSWNGISVHGDPKYQPGFTSVDYANPSAPKGGQLTLGWTGSFDTLNPYSTKGQPPLLIQQLVFETLGASSLDEPFSVYPLLSDSIKVAKDRLSMVITISKNARFSDGKPITGADVLLASKPSGQMMFQPSITRIGQISAT